MSGEIYHEGLLPAHLALMNRRSVDRIKLARNSPGSNLTKEWAVTMIDALEEDARILDQISVGEPLSESDAANFVPVSNVFPTEYDG